MAHTRRTLTLDKRFWDLETDGTGLISVTAEDMATAQNVANEARLFTNDAYFIQDQGIPHYIIELGNRVNYSVLRSRLRNAALRVPDVAEVLSVEILSFDPTTRLLTGDIRFTTLEGEVRQEMTTYF